MKYHFGNCVKCESKGDGKELFMIEGVGEENGHDYYILVNLNTLEKETLLVTFVDDKFECVPMLKVFYLYLYYYLGKLGKK